MKLRTTSYYTILIHLFALLILPGCQKDHFTIEGNLRHVNVSKAYLVHINPVLNKVEIIDSSEVNEGNFTFHGSAPLPIACQIKIGRRTSINLMVENADISVSGTIQIPEETKIEGSRSEQEFKYLIDTYNGIEATKNKMWADMFGNNNRHVNDTIKEKITTIEDSLLSITLNYVKKKPKSVAAAYFVYYLYLDRQMDLKRLRPIIELFSDEISNSEYIKYLHEEIRLATVEIKPGSTAPMFHVPGIDGITLTTDTFRDKYLFLDFTASWFGGWKTRNKKLKKIKDKHSGMPFEILSYYIDSNPKTLEKRLKENPFPWHHASNFEYWESPITKYYGVNHIPMGFLIDQQGKIMAIDPSADQIDSILQTNTPKTRP